MVLCLSPNLVSSIVRPMNNRTYTPADKLIGNIDNAMRTIFGRPQLTERPNPAKDIDDVEMNETDKKTRRRPNAR